MSKLPPVKYAQHFIQQPNRAPEEQNSSNRNISKKQIAVVSRDVNLPVQAQQDGQHNVIATYKDLNQEIDVQLKKQQQQLMFAFGIFILLGIGILISQSMHKPSRQIASTFDGFQVEGTPTHSEHYQFDKNCYEGADGEQVCMTRESKKK